MQPAASSGGSGSEEGPSPDGCKTACPDAIAPPKKPKRSPAEGELPCEYDGEPAEEVLTACAGIPRMIKSGQVEELSQAGFHYITAISKPRIDTLIAARLIRMELFAAEICEVQQQGVRYVPRRNPIRAEQLAASRADKQARVEQLQRDRSRHLGEQPRAKVATAVRSRARNSPSAVNPVKPEQLTGENPLGL